MQTLLPFLLAMVAAVVLLNMWATRLRIAYPILLVTAGLLICFIPGLPHVHIDPELIFFIFLPPLLFEAAWSASFKEMRKWWRIIGSFAFLVVFFTAFSVAMVTSNVIPGFTLALGFLLGGIVSPPDAVSTGAITRFVRIPRSTAAVLEGESLLNDASSLIIFRFALVAVATGQFVWQTAVLSFFWMVLGGAAIGLLLAWCFVQAHRRLPTDAPSDIALMLIEPYFMYWVAEELHSSGVLAVVAGGLYMSAKRLTYLNSTSRIKGHSVWESFVFILNGIVFLMIGLDMPEIVGALRANGIPLGTAIGYGVLVTGVLILARIISSYAAMLATIIFRPSVIPHASRPRRRWATPLLLGWTGMRGVVSLAAALAIPVSLTDGIAFPHRSLILFITFVVILLTLVVQGLTLPYLITRSRLFFGMFPEPDEATATAHLRRSLMEHTRGFMQGKIERGELAHPHAEAWMRKWEKRSKASDDTGMTDAMRTLFLEMIESQRNFLDRLNKDPKVEEELIRRQLFLIDLEEERLRHLS